MTGGQAILRSMPYLGTILLAGLSIGPHEPVTGLKLIMIIFYFGVMRFIFRAAFDEQG